MVGTPVGPILAGAALLPHVSYFAVFADLYDGFIWSVRKDQF